MNANAAQVVIPNAVRNLLFPGVRKADSSPAEADSE